MAFPVAVTRSIAAPPSKVWEMVSDLPRMGEWSPENCGGRWTKGDGPTVGARFKGKNRNGVLRWSTSVRVQEATPGASFEIAVSFAGFSIANWRYDFEANSSGCAVTESWDDRRSGWLRIGARVLGDHGPEHARGEMAATLEKLAAAAEATSTVG